ncbi:hypothetical protein HYW32_00160 [Candidatus Berkelbacteria bacterium]|nr:hypothetical protein [Candidatus Berkelbacteria bacterium]
MAVEPVKFWQALEKENLGPIFQVPCSIFKNFLNFCYDTDKEVYNPVHEGIALVQASGAYLATGKLPIVMLQNSGFGNLLNPLTSLNQVYDIPALLMMSWRGADGRGTDAPEHDEMGTMFLKILKAANVASEILDERHFGEQIYKSSQLAQSQRRPTALILKKDFFAPYQARQSHISPAQEFTRHHVISVIKNWFGERAIYLSSTGFPSRDSFNVRDTPDFYIMGSMGYTGALGLHIAKSNDRPVVLFEGDGSVLMHIGALASIAALKPKNLIHFVLDNEAYDSTGFQPSLSKGIDLCKIAEGFGYTYTLNVREENDLRTLLATVESIKGPILIRVKVGQVHTKTGQRVSDKYSPVQITDRFMENLRSGYLGIQESGNQARDVVEVNV